MKWELSSSNTTKKTNRIKMKITLPYTVAGDILGSRKLGCEGAEGVRVVLEEDGSVVDDDEVLLELQGQTLLLLASGEEWSPYHPQPSMTDEPVPQAPQPCQSTDCDGDTAPPADETEIRHVASAAQSQWNLICCLVYFIFHFDWLTVKHTYIHY